MWTANRAVSTGVYIRPVSKHWKPGRKAVDVRRDPVRAAESKEPPSTEREVWSTVAGVVLFALVCAAPSLGISETTSHSPGFGTPPAGLFGQCYNRGGPNCVLDGDTIYFEGKKVEVAGIDAPEIETAGCPAEVNRGIEVAGRVVDLLNSGKVTIAGAERGSDGQLLQRVEVDGRDVGNAMIRAGLARKYGAGPQSWCG